jgi:hypothetical protein
VLFGGRHCSVQIRLGSTVNRQHCPQPRKESAGVHRTGLKFPRGHRIKLTRSLQDQDRFAGPADGSHNLERLRVTTPGRGIDGISPTLVSKQIVTARASHRA